MTRIVNPLLAAALATCLYLSGSAFATPLDEMPALPIDQIAPTSTGGFASVATPNTQVDTPDPITDTNGQPTTTENSPEPATLTLLGLGGVCAWCHLRRRK